MQVNAVANFSQLKSQITELKAQIAAVQRESMALGDSAFVGMAERSKIAMQNFEKMVLATKAFNVQAVKMTSAVDHFGTTLEKNQLGLSRAWSMWRQEAKGGAKLLDDLAARQTRLLKSTFIPDPNMQGYSKAVTSVNASMKELGAQAEFAKIRMSALNSVMREVGTGMVNFGKNTQWAGRQLTVGLTMPLVMFGAAASKAYLDFDKQMTSMLKVYGAHAVVQSQQTLDTIEKSVTNLADKLARTLGVAMGDTTEIAKTFSSIGLESQNLIDATDATVRLMKLGDLQANQAAGSMVSLQNVFKLQANQVSSAVDFLNAAKHSTSTTMQDIIDAIPRVGPIIQQMGGTYKDFVAFIVAMKESGVPAAQGANAIKSMLASIIKPTAQARKDFKAMGIDLEGLAKKNSNNVMGMVQGLQASLDKLPKAEKLRAIEELFGKFQFARVTALMDNLGKKGSQSAKVLELYGQTNDQLAAVAKQELDVASSQTPAAQFQKMKATLQADLIPLGKSFLKSFTSLGNAVDKVVNAFKSISKALGPVAGLLGSLFSKGLAGIIIIGPLTMLSGLFINLAGQIFKMGNFARMFREGWKDGGFKGAIENINNYFKQVDLSLIAANEESLTFKDTVISTAEAFAVLNTEVSKLRVLMTPRTSMPLMPYNEGMWGMYPSEKDKKTLGIIRPHMYAGSRLREDWMGMSESQRMNYPNLMMAQSQMGPEKFLGEEKGYLTRGLSAQWIAAPPGVGDTLNKTYNNSPAVYGGATGAAKEEILARGTQRLVQLHNNVILGVEKKDELTIQQLQDIFGTELVKAEELSAEQQAKVQKALEMVTFEEGRFKQNLVESLIQQQAVLEAFATSEGKMEVVTLRTKIGEAYKAEEGKRLPLITQAWEEFNATLTQDALAQITAMRMRITAAMAPMAESQAAMFAAEEQTAISLAAGRSGFAPLMLSTSQDSKMLRQSLQMATLKMPKPFAVGGYVSGPGGPTEDKIPAMLSGGEYVIKASSVSKYGRSTLDAINNGYAIGGMIHASGGIEVPPLGKEFRPNNIKGLSRGENYLWNDLSPNKKGNYGPVARRLLPKIREVLNLQGLPPGEIDRLMNSFATNRNPINAIDRKIIAGALETGINTGMINLKAETPWTQSKIIASIHNEGLRNIDPRLLSEIDPKLPTMYAKPGRRDAPNPIRQAAKQSFFEAYQGVNLGKEVLDLSKKYGVEFEKLKWSMMNPQAAHLTEELMLMRAKGGQIPAMLSNGEYVMSPETVSKFGPGFMAGINNGTAKLARGGHVSSPLKLNGGGPSRMPFGIGNAYNINTGATDQARMGGAGANRGVLRMSADSGVLASAQSQLKFATNKVSTILSEQSQIWAARGQLGQEALAELSGAMKKTGPFIMQLGTSAKESAASMIAAAKAPKPGQPGFIGPMLPPKPGEPGFIGPMPAPEGSKALSGLKSLGGKLNPMKMSMPQMMGGMVMGQALGMGLNAAQGHMKDGVEKSAVGGAATGAQMGAMFGPYGVAIGALAGAAFGGISKAWQEHKDKIANAAAGVHDAVTLDSTAIQTLGIHIRSLSDISINAAGSITKTTSAVQKIADAYKTSADPGTQAALKNLQELSKDATGNRTEIQRIAQSRYAMEISAGADPKKAAQDIAGYLKAGGVGGMTAGKIGQSLTRINTSNALGATVAEGVHGAGGAGAGSAMFTAVQSADPTKLASMIDHLGKAQRAAINTHDAFKSYNDIIRQSDPDLASFNETLINNKVSAESVYKVNTLMALGWKGSAADAQYLANNVGILNFKLETLGEKQQAVAVLQQQASQAQENQTSTIQKAGEHTQTYYKNKEKAVQGEIDGMNAWIDTQNKLIAGIQKQKDAREKLFQLGQQEIEQQHTLSGLKDQVTKARGSGDLLALAEAQSAYNIEVAKQSELKKKQAADSADDKRIAILTTGITHAQDVIKGFETELKRLQTAAETAATRTQTQLNNVGTTAEDNSDKLNTIGTTATSVLNGGNWTNRTELQTLLEQKIGPALKEQGLDPITTINAMLDDWQTKGLITQDAKINQGLQTVINQFKGIKDSAEKAAIAHEAFILFKEAKGKLTYQQAAERAKDFVQTGHAAHVSGTGHYTASGTGTRNPTPKGGARVDNSNGTSYWIFKDSSTNSQNPKPNEYSIYITKNKEFWNAHGKGWYEFSSNGTILDQYKKTTPVGNFTQGKGKYATGGLIYGPGTGTSDSIPAMLSKGEYVVKASAVSQYGTGLMEAINNKTYATGGIVRYAGGGSVDTTNTPSYGDMVYNITVNAATNADPDEIARTIMRTIKADARTLSTPRNIGSIGS